MIKRPILILLSALCAACSSLPKAELQAYRDSFTAAQTAATPMIADYAAGERAERLAILKGTSTRYSAENPYFDTFRRTTDVDAVSSVGFPPGAEAVDRAFRAIGGYNDVLVALAENRNIGEARDQLRQIVSDAATIVPIGASGQAVASAVTGIISQILTPLIERDNRNEIRRIVIQGYDPMVNLIDLLIAHSEDQYASTVSPMVEQLENGAGDRAVLIQRVNGYHRAYADYVVLLQAVRSRFAELKLALENPRRASVLARASAGTAELRSYADGLRRSLDELRRIQ